jgi:hypothetical protein
MPTTTRACRLSRLVSDPNRNRAQVAFDTLGMVAGTAIMGKPLPDPVEGDTLTGFVADLTQAELDQFMAAPRQPSPNALLRRRDDARLFMTSCGVPPHASCMTWIDSCAWVSRPSQAPLPANPTLASCSRTQKSKTADQLLLLRRLRPRNPEEDPGRARPNY